jgi:hypothetical protein
MHYRLAEGSQYLSQARAVVALWSLRAQLVERGQKPY